MFARGLHIKNQNHPVFMQCLTGLRVQTQVQTPKRVLSSHNRNLNLNLDPNRSIVPSVLPPLSAASYTYLQQSSENVADSLTEALKRGGQHFFRSATRLTRLNPLIVLSMKPVQRGRRPGSN